MSDDDDLPVLTQVLRIGSVRPSAAIEERSAAAGLPEANTAEAPLLADPLVIGEPPPKISAYLAPTDPDTTDDGGGKDAPGNDSRSDEDGATAPNGPDALLPQDHDGGGPRARASTLDVPAPDGSTPPAASALVETPARDAAVLARRIRDAVVDDLRTRIDTELDARIAQALHAEVETVLARLQQNLRAHLSDALHDVVAKAVDETIAGRSNGDPPIA